MIGYRWRGSVGNTEMNRLHAEAFGTRVYTDEEWDWVDQLEHHSLGWVTAREGNDLVGFVNVVSDGLVHSWLQDTMVANTARHRGIGTRLIEMAIEEARGAGCEWLHVDFDASLRPFYLESCGFTPTSAGLIEL